MYSASVTGINRTTILVSLATHVGVRDQVKEVDPAGYLDRLSVLGDLAKTSGRVK